MADISYPELLERIKNKLAPITESMKDGKDADDELLKEVKEDAMDILIFLKNYLISKNDPFTALFFKGLELKIDFKLPGLMKCIPKPSQMLFNPLFVEKYDITQLAYEVKKQIMHLVYNHQAHIKKLGGNKDDIRKISMANDAQVNDVINHEELSKFKTKSGALKLNMNPEYYTSETVEKISGITCKEKDTNLYYTKILDSTVDNMQEAKDNPKGDGDCPIPQNPGVREGNPGDQPGGENDVSFNSKSHGGIKTPDNTGDTDIHDYGSKGKGSEELEDDARRIIEDAMNNMTAKERGEMSGSVMQQINIMLEPPKLDWKKILQRFVGSIPEGKRRSPFRLNRKMPTNPSVRGKLNDKTIDIIVGLDTSGSMSKEEIDWSFSEMKGILGSRNYKITVVECDWEIGAIYDLDNRGNKVENVKEVSGRGGTQFAPVIRYINDREYRDEVNERMDYSHKRNPKESLFIYFTDGGGEWEIDRPNVHRAMWVLTRPIEEMSVKDLHGGALVSLVDDATFTRTFR